MEIWHYDYCYFIGSAINLSGLTHTRMRRRLEELGIRKSFGATQGELVWQVLNENFVLTLIGGMLGLGLSYLCLWLMSDWLLQTAWGATATMNVSMVSPVVFFVALCFCLVLNFAFRHTFLPGVLPILRLSIR